MAVAPVDETRMVTGKYDASMVDDLDMVGRIHAPDGGSSDLDGPLVRMNALQGLAATTVIIMSSDLDRPAESRLLHAFGKLLWNQNDRISRHYRCVA